MFTPITIDEFMKINYKNSPDENDIRNALIHTIEAKKAGANCNQCGQPIWAIGSAIAGWNGCFTCISGEGNNSEDYEIDSVC